MHYVLVIEEDADVRDNIVELLEFEEYKVKSVDNEWVADDLMTQFVPNVIICDLVSSNIDVQQYYEKIRNNEQLCATSIIFMTSDNPDDVKSLPSDIFYLTKPFSSEDLYDVIKTAIDIKGQLVLK